MSRKAPADGRRDDDPEGAPKSTPAHEVSIDKAFAVAIYDVTLDEYAAFVRDTGELNRDGCYIWNDGQWVDDKKRDWRDPGFRQTGRDPVVCVNWEDAQAYLRWLNGRMQDRHQTATEYSSGPYRLLSWEEAEYVAGGSATTLYYWGDFASRNKANYGADRCFPCRGSRKDGDHWLYTSPVGSFPPNSFGLYDMAGNAWQWTDGCYPHRDPPPPAGCRYGAVHGGSWLDNPEYLRTQEYAINDRLNRNTATGFRVARTLE